MYGPGQKRGGAGDIQQLTFARSNLRQKEFGQMRQGNDVDLQHLRFDVPVRLQERTLRTKARIVDQNVQHHAGFLQLLVKLER